MDSIRIQGGIALQGKVRVQGSKNASLPVLAATLLVLLHQELSQDSGCACHGQPAEKPGVQCVLE